MTLVEPIPLVDLAPVRRAHFIAIGGAGMSPIAQLWHQRGIDVDGCDQADSQTAARLRADGIPVTIGHQVDHLTGVDTVVVSSAIRDDNPELLAAKAANLRVWHRSAALAAVMAGSLGVAISGTHGKSTTSAMVAAGLSFVDPSYVLGATLVETGSSSHQGRPGGVFVIEADESDGSYLQYEPQVVVLTNVEADHLDRWGTPQAYAAGFESFVGGPTVRQVVLNADDSVCQAMAKRLQSAGRPVVTYGQSEDAMVRLGDCRVNRLSSTADLTWSDGQAQLAIGLPGRHNLQNAAAAFATAVAVSRLGQDIDLGQVIKGLASYRGIQRRFQLVGQIRGIDIVDDYAHHPTEISAAIATARLVAGQRRLVVCFQPHLFTRTRDFANQFGQALAKADIVVVCDVYPAREDPLPGVTGELVAKAARQNGAEVIYAPTLTQAVDVLASLVDSEKVGAADLIMTVGAGDVTTVGYDLLARFQGCETNA